MTNCTKCLQPILPKQAYCKTKRGRHHLHCAANSDFQQADQEKAQLLLNEFIAWVDADHEDTLILSRNQCTYMRDEIIRLRKMIDARIALLGEGENKP